MKPAKLLSLFIFISNFCYSQKIKLIEADDSVLKYDTPRCRANPFAWQSKYSPPYKHLTTITSSKIPFSPE